MVGDPRGQRCGDVLERAAERVEEIRETCVAGLDEKIERIHELSQSGDEAVVAQCYDVSNEIFAIAGAFELEELSGAAHSLCVLLASACRGARSRRRDARSPASRNCGKQDVARGDAERVAQDGGASQRRPGPAKSA